MASDAQVKKVLKTRPMPPDDLWENNGGLFATARDVGEWARQHIINQEGILKNADHKHLKKVDIGFLWTSEEYFKGGYQVIGLCEEPSAMGNKWLKARHDRHLESLLGRVPKFLITLYAPYLATADHAHFCALVEHELYHIGHLRDEFGELRFNRDGDPVVGKVGHGVEEHPGIVRRYGAGNAAGQTAELVRYASLPPEVAAANISRACGSCSR